MTKDVAEAEDRYALSASRGSDASMGIFCFAEGQKIYHVLRDSVSIRCSLDVPAFTNSLVSKLTVSKRRGSHLSKFSLRLSQLVGGFSLAAITGG